ncbi:hypothetical protein vseg_001494 [Gypsophila vaccaria]
MLNVRRPGLYRPSDMYLQLQVLLQKGMNVLTPGGSCFREPPPCSMNLIHAGQKENMLLTAEEMHRNFKRIINVAA